MRVLLFCAAVAIPSFTWTQGLGNGWLVKKSLVPLGNGFVILADPLPINSTTLPAGIIANDTFEFVEGVVKDFNRNGVADSEQRYSFPVRQIIFIVLPPIENTNPHVLARAAQTTQHRVILEFLDESGCVYGRPEDMKHDATGNLVIDLLSGPCRADR